jgi:penicillin V acylase-like amidase (Ntn superfamily)
MGRLVLETCRTVEEAKIAFLANKVYLSLWGIHYMVYDSTGRSTVVEWNKDDGNLYFTDGNTSRPSIMTTLYKVILDLTEKSLKVKRFLKPGPVDNATNESTLVFSPYVTFKMNKIDNDLLS